MRCILLTLAAVLCTAAVSSAQTPEAIVQGLMSDDAATRQAAEATCVTLGAPMVKPLCDLMAAGDTKSVTVAERALFAVAAEASAPGADEATARALAAEVRGERPARVRRHVVYLLSPLAGREALWALYRALADPETTDAALASLQRQPRNDVARHLGILLVSPPPRLAGLPAAFPAQSTDAVLQALGGMRNPEATRFLVAYLGARGAHRAVALDALGKTADPRAAAVLAEAASDPDEAIRSAAVGALIALADAEQQRGGELARRCYRRAYDHAVTPAQKTAALMGLTDTDPSMRIQWLLKGMGEEHARPVAYAELLNADAGQLAGPLAARMAEGQEEELEALRELAGAKGIAIGE